MWVVYISGYNFSGVPVERRRCTIWAQPSILYIPSLQLGHERVSLLMSLRLRCVWVADVLCVFLRSSDFKALGQVQLLHSPHFHTDESPLHPLKVHFFISFTRDRTFSVEFSPPSITFGDRTLAFRCSVSV
jgi:hypothetical protein